MRIATILIVEDEPDIRNTLIEILRDEGYRAIGFGSGTEALAFLVQTEPDLVLLDWFLYDMNGSDFLHRLNSVAWKHIPVFITSAGFAGTDPLPTSCKIVAKPYDIKKLLAEIALVLASPGSV